MSKTINSNLLDRIMERNKSIYVISHVTQNRAHGGAGKCQQLFLLNILKQFLFSYNFQNKILYI